MNHLWVPPSVRRYRQLDLLAVARDLGCSDVKPRTVRTFIELGLVDHPRRDWPGYGGGSTVGWWPRPQFDLWSTLLLQRKQIAEREGRKSRVYGALCNVVVSAWLYFGDASGIPLAQVRRAMRTWAGANATVGSASEAQRAAGRFVRTAAHPQTQGRLALRGEIAQMLLSGRYPDREELLYRMETLVDPLGRGETKGPDEAPFAAENLTDMVLGRVKTIERLGGSDDQLPDGIWGWARFVLLWSRGRYQVAQPRLAGDPSLRKHPELVRLYEPETLETMVNAACADLLTVLAASEPARRATHLPLELRPDPWLAGQVQLRVEAQQHVSELVRADGGRQVYLRESVQLIWQGAHSEPQA